jgi:hypothetical protein
MHPFLNWILTLSPIVHVALLASNFSNRIGAGDVMGIRSNRNLAPNVWLFRHAVMIKSTSVLKIIYNEIFI